MNHTEYDDQPWHHYIRDFEFLAGQFTVVGLDDNISHYGSTTSFSFDESPPEEHIPSVLNVNCGNVNKTRLENVANQNVHLHLHYTEIYSTSKDGGEPIRTERFDYDMAPGADLPPFVDFDAEEQDHKRSLDGVFSRALDMADKSKKSRELKKTFKALLGLLKDDLVDEGNASNSIITEDEDNCSESTEFFSAPDIPSLSPHPTPLAAYPSNKSESHDADLEAIPWTETVHDFVNSVTAMSRRAAGIRSASESDDCPDPNSTRTLPTPPSPPLQAPSSISAAQGPLCHPDLVSLIQDSVSEAVKKQFAALHLDSAASSSHSAPTRPPPRRPTPTRGYPFSLRPSLSPSSQNKRTWDARDEPSALKGILEGGRIVCDYRQVKARLLGRRDPTHPGALIKERTIGRSMIPLANPPSPVGAVEDEGVIRTRRQIKRPRLAHQKFTLDGYDADGDDSEGG